MIRKMIIDEAALKPIERLGPYYWYIAKNKESHPNENNLQQVYVLTESELEYFAYVVANYVQNYPKGLDPQMFQEAFVKGLNSND